jgi:translation initiation factor 1
MKKNLFEIGRDFKDSWSSDNRDKITQKNIEILPRDKHKLYFKKEKRRGKIITIVKPFYLNKKELQEILKSIKKSIGTGGSIKGNTIELQGDIKDKLKEPLIEFGFKFK